MHGDVHSKRFLDLGTSPLVLPFVTQGAKYMPPLCKLALTVCLHCDWLQQRHASQDVKRVLSFQHMLPVALLRPGNITWRETVV